jgi:hypothetical protein
MASVLSLSRECQAPLLSAQVNSIVPASFLGQEGWPIMLPVVSFPWQVLQRGRVTRGRSQVCCHPFPVSLELPVPRFSPYFLLLLDHRL